MNTDAHNDSETCPTQTRASAAEATAQSSGYNREESLPWQAMVEPTELFGFKECQDLFRKRLQEPVLRLVTHETGLRLHRLWHHPLEFKESVAPPIACPWAHRRKKSKAWPPARCELCLQRHWKPASFAGNQGRRFTGTCGITNYCVCLQVDNIRPLTLVLQATVAYRTSAAVSRPECQPLPAVHLEKAISPAHFKRAVALVRLIVHDLVSTADIRMVRSRLNHALRKLNFTEIEAARLRGTLCRQLPGLPESPVEPCSGSHSQQLVEVMVGYIQQHGHCQIRLGELASAMKMNASYLSALFSQTTGMTFHRFLETVRLARAKELLRDPRNRIGEVANATGYASPDAFRHAFKAIEGLSPEAWRTGP